MRLPRICRAGPLSESMGHHVSKGGCAHTCRHTYMHTYTHTCIHTQHSTHTHTHIHTHTHTRTHTHNTHTHTHTHTHARTHAHTYTHTHTHAHTHAHTHTHTHTHTHARTHTHKHTHTHTHTPEQCTQVCILAVNINKQFPTANIPRPQVSVWPNSGQRPHPHCQHQHFPRVQLPTGCRQVSSDGQICDNSAMLADYQTTGHFLVPLQTYASALCLQ